MLHYRSTKQVEYMPIAPNRKMYVFEQDIYIKWDKKYIHVYMLFIIYEHISNNIFNTFNENATF